MGAEKCEPEDTPRNLRQGIWSVLRDMTIGHVLLQGRESGSQFVKTGTTAH
jgi:hypothetical protein